MCRNTDPSVYGMDACSSGCPCACYSCAPSPFPICWPRLMNQGYRSSQRRALLSSRRYMFISVIDMIASEPILLLTRAPETHVFVAGRGCLGLHGTAIRISTTTRLKCPGKDLSGTTTTLRTYNSSRPPLLSPGAGRKHQKETRCRGVSATETAVGPSAHLGRNVRAENRSVQRGKVTYGNTGRYLCPPENTRGKQ